MHLERALSAHWSETMRMFLVAWHSTATEAEESAAEDNPRKYGLISAQLLVDVHSIGNEPLESAAPTLATVFCMVYVLWGRVLQQAAAAIVAAQKRPTV